METCVKKLMNAAFYVLVPLSYVRLVTCDLPEIFLLFKIKLKLWTSPNQPLHFFEMEKNVASVIADDFFILKVVHVVNMNNSENCMWSHLVI